MASVCHFNISNFIESFLTYFHFLFVAQYDTLRHVWTTQAYLWLYICILLSFIAKTRMSNSLFKMVDATKD